MKRNVLEDTWSKIGAVVHYFQIVRTSAAVGDRVVQAPPEPIYYAKVYVKYDLAHRTAEEQKLVEGFRGKYLKMPVNSDDALNVPTVVIV